MSVHLLFSFFFWISCCIGIIVSALAWDVPRGSHRRSHRGSQRKEGRTESCSLQCALWRSARCAVRNDAYSSGNLYCLLCVGKKRATAVPVPFDFSPFSFFFLGSLKDIGAVGRVYLVSSFLSCDSAQTAGRTMPKRRRVHLQGHAAKRGHHARRSLFAFFCLRQTKNRPSPAYWPPPHDQEKKRKIQRSTIYLWSGQPNSGNKCLFLL